ncbi:MAG TPA: MFS transporter [Acidobacteriaceae bacterium]|jgi:MFS family permease|nr:MFS transporter [Acidobacteriaceae bacterium]
MEVLVEPATPAVRFWKGPHAWLAEQRLQPEFWRFFAAAFFFDAGFAVYFFLFNLYLLDVGFDERTMGMVGGALTLGSVVGTLPAGALTRRFGVRRLLMVCFVAAPLVGAVRAVWMWRPAQIGCAFVAGVAMCLWGVCFLPAVARLTEDRNRASGFGLIFSASVGTSAVGGLVCGYLPHWLQRAGVAMSAAEVKRGILLGSCGIALLGLVALRRLRVPEVEEVLEQRADNRWMVRWRPHGLALRLVPLIALWAAIQAAFTPFAMVHLTRDFRIPLTQVGLLFSVAQLLQLGTGLATPVLFRMLGLVRGIVVTQLATAMALGMMAVVHEGRAAVALYLCFAAAQWMSSPGMYNLLMSETPDAERGSVAAVAMFCNALVSAGATWIAGVMLMRVGYPVVMVSTALSALAVAMVFGVSVTGRVRGRRSVER